MKTLFNTKSALSLAGLLMFTSQVNAGNDIWIDDAWIRSAPPNASVMAGYMKIENHGHKAVSLNGAASPAYQRVEIHQSVMKSDMAHMMAVDEIRVPVHGEVKLAPGGYHLMLMKPKQRIKRGDKISITLIFKDGAKITTEAIVRDDEDSDDTQQHEHHHHH